MRIFVTVLCLLMLSLPCAAQFGSADDDRGTNLPPDETAGTSRGAAGHAGWADVADLVASGAAGPAPAWIGDRYWRRHEKGDREDRVDTRIVRPLFGPAWPVRPLPWGYGWQRFWSPRWRAGWHAHPPVRAHYRGPWVPYRF